MGGRPIRSNVARRKQRQLVGRRRWAEAGRFEPGEHEGDRSGPWTQAVSFTARRIGAHDRLKGPPIGPGPLGVLQHQIGGPGGAAAIHSRSRATCSALEGGAVFGHFGLIARDILDQQAFVGLAGTIAGAALAPFQQALAGGQRQTALGLLALVASHAAAGEDRPDLLAKHRLVGGLRVRQG